MLRKFVCLVLVCAAPLLWADEGGEPSKLWVENEYVLPAPPLPERLHGFYVGAATDNRFFVDVASLSVGSDGVVRYTLVVLSPGGGRNVTFEGIRCETKERRIYATGHLDGEWSRSRSVQWVRIQEVYGNRHHAALYLDYFCPAGIVVGSVDEARQALLAGGHSMVRR